MSFKCTSAGPCKVVALDRHQLWQTLKANPRLEAAANRAEVADLWGKLHGASHELRLRSLHAMVDVVLCDQNVNEAERKAVSSFVARHQIPPHELEKCLSRAGWTMQQYARGTRKSVKAADCE